MGTICEVERIINEFCESAPSNSLHLETGEKAWAEPHVAIARGDDPLFLGNKEMIGPFLWTPEEAYALAFPDSPVPARELRVISYVLPQTPKTRADQRLEDRMPAERWARSRFHGEEFNCDLRLHLAETLTRAGYPSVAPERLPGFGYQHSERFGLASNWSERHAAFVAGHGTFGLSDGMITRWGKAVRFGSVVSRIDLPVRE
jgi:epoxyqueuosine reductase QueG